MPSNGVIPAPIDTQYNDFNKAYDWSRKKSIALIEKENVRSVIEPMLEGARVLELACGSGFYSTDLVSWGAHSVVAVDVSDVMIHVAKNSKNGHNVEFHVADCISKQSYPGTPFDIVFAAWLLDNASSRSVLLHMMQNVAHNLKPGGHFVTVTVAPTHDPRAEVEKKNKLFPPPDGAGGVVIKILDELQDGLRILVHGSTPFGDVNIDCYYLRKDVIEETAREAGLTGRLTWNVTQVPEHYLAAGVNEVAGGASLQELRNYALAPQYGILTVAKAHESDS